MKTMKIKSLRYFLENIIVENLHPDLKNIVSQKTSPYGPSKQAQLARAIKDITKRGEETGLEGNMPKGSSRAYLHIKEDKEIDLDNIPRTRLPTGMKVAVRATLDKHHDSSEHDGKSLGQLQNEAEGGDHFANGYRVIYKDHQTGKYHTNESGIFPPLIDHDHDTHEWSHVGHVDKITKPKFRELTKTSTHPNGINHQDFHNALLRSWNRNNGSHWKLSDKEEKRLDHIESHPLVQKFLDHQGTFGAPPHDYQQLGNLGVWTHPHTGEQHIVARDHGFSSDVMKAYSSARKNMTNLKFYQSE